VPWMTAVSEIIMGKKRNYAPLWKTPDFPEKYPETQTRPKKPRPSGKTPAVVTLVDDNNTSQPIAASESRLTTQSANWSWAKVNFCW